MESIDSYIFISLTLSIIFSKLILTTIQIVFLLKVLFVILIFHNFNFKIKANNHFESTFLQCRDYFQVQTSSKSTFEKDHSWHLAIKALYDLHVKSLLCTLKNRLKYAKLKQFWKNGLHMNIQPFLANFNHMI